MTYRKALDGNSAGIDKALAPWFGFGAGINTKRVRPSVDVVRALRSPQPYSMGGTCLAFLSQPPFVTGLPLPPGVRLPWDFTVADPQSGVIEMVIGTWADDPGGIVDGSGVIYKQRVAQITPLVFSVPSTWSSPVLNITANVEIKGNTLGAWRDPAIGETVVWCMVRLSASVGSTFADDVELPVCSVNDPVAHPTYQVKQTLFNETIQPTVQVRVVPWDRVTIGVSAEIYVAVPVNSTAFTSADFGRLAGSIRLTSVVGTC